MLLCCGFNRKQDLEPILIFSEICVCKVTRGFSLVCVFGVFLLLLALEDSFFLFQLFFFNFFTRLEKGLSSLAEDCLALS